MTAFLNKTVHNSVSWLRHTGAWTLSVHWSRRFRIYRNSIEILAAVQPDVTRMYLGYQSTTYSLLLKLTVLAYILLATSKASFIYFWLKQNKWISKFCHDVKFIFVFDQRPRHANLQTTSTVHYTNCCMKLFKWTETKRFGTLAWEFNLRHSYQGFDICRRSARDFALSIGSV